MNNDAFNRVRSIEEMEARVERDLISTAKTVKAELTREVDVAIHNVEGTAEIATTAISAQTEVAVARLTASMEVASVRMLAAAERAIGDVEGKVAAEAPQSHAEITKAMVAEAAYLAQQDLAETMKKSVESIRLDAIRAVADIRKAAADSIAEIKRFADQTTTSIDRNAQLAADRILQAKNDDRTPEALAREAETAAREVLDAAKATSALLKKTLDACVARISAHAADSEKRISALADAAQEKMETVHQKASDRIAEVFHLRAAMR